MPTSTHAYFLDGSDVSKALEKTSRIYLTGHLERPQAHFAHIDCLAEPTEVGITRYATLTIDQAHLHSSNTDFAYVVRGEFAVRIIPTGEVHVLGPDSLCIVEPGLAHVCIAQPDTQVLFFKLPGGNDKVLVELDDDSRAWIDSYCRSCESNHR